MDFFTRYPMFVKGRGSLNVSRSAELIALSGALEAATSRRPRINGPRALEGIPFLEP